MTKEQEEAIEILKEIQNGSNMCLIAENPKNIEDIEHYKNEAEAIETVLNMLKEKDKYIKDANDITTEMSKDIKKLISEIEKKDKMIDLLLDKINENYNNAFNSNEVKEIVTIYENIQKNTKLTGFDLRKECIKQYYAGLVEKE